MQGVSRWAVWSSACAPLVLVGGWVVAAMLQPPGYDPRTQTISSLAAYGSADRWLMTAAIFVTGVCHIVTALGLRAAAASGRVVLAVGGVASILVALFPEPDSGASLRHTAATSVGIAALAAWPVLAADRAPRAPWALKPALSVVVSVLMLAAAVWFLVALRRHADIGLAERVLTTGQTLWPLVVVVSCLGRAARDPAGPS